MAPGIQALVTICGSQRTVLFLLHCLRQLSVLLPRQVAQRAVVWPLTHSNKLLTLRMRLRFDLQVRILVPRILVIDCESRHWVISPFLVYPKIVKEEECIFKIFLLFCIFQIKFLYFNI